MTHTDDNATLDTVTMLHSGYGLVTLYPVAGTWAWRTDAGRVSRYYPSAAAAVQAFARFEEK